MKIISVQEMKDLDRQTIASGTPGTLLMERAGVGVCEAVLDLTQRLHQRFCRQITVVAGKGNNGGDAFVTAGLLARKTEFPISVYSVAPLSKLQDAPAYFAATLPPRVKVVECGDKLPGEALTSGTVVIDGLLGTGIKGRLKEPYKTIINQINDSGLPVVSIDIPSGLDGDTGEVVSTVINADMTVTMAFPKRGLVNDNGILHCGQLRCVDIGIPTELAAEAETCDEAVFTGDAAELLPLRPPNSHKGSYGHTLVAGGSKWYTGAPVMSATAALRSGAGLVTMAVPESIRTWFANAPQALIFLPVPDNQNGFLNHYSITDVTAAAENADSIVLGPGIGQSAEVAEVVRTMLNTGKPIVVDADALRLLGEQPDLLKSCRASEVVLTPHPGEMKMLLQGFGLTNHIDADRRNQAYALAQETGTTVVLKGLGTVIVDNYGKTAINTSGTNALSTAGTGDVLAGIIGGLLAQGLTPSAGAKLGTFIHGRAAEIRGLSRRAMIADDLLDGITDVYRELSPDA